MTRTLTSPWANVLDNTNDLICAIVPHVAAKTRWRYLPPTVAFDGAGARSFTIGEVSQEPERYIAGAGSVEEHVVVTYLCRYLPGEMLEDMIGQDHIDWINAVQPAGTYSTGAWGSIRFRKVEAPQRGEVSGETGELIVSRPVTIYYRYNVTLT